MNTVKMTDRREIKQREAGIREIERKVTVKKGSIQREIAKKENARSDLGMESDERASHRNSGKRSAHVIRHRTGNYPGKKEWARIAQLRQYLFVIRELTSREIKRKYARSSLGIIWSILNPLLTMIVMSLIFSTMFRRAIENYPVYYLTGQIFWTLFSTATNSSMSALVDNKSLLVKAKLPKQTFILSRIYTALVNFGYTCIAYALILLVFRIRPGIAILLFPVDVVFCVVFSAGIGYMLAVVYVFFADIKYLYNVLLTLLMYMSALFYPVSRLSETMQRVVGMNPVYLMVAFARDCVLYGKVPDADIWYRLGLWSMGSFLLGLFLFYRKENQVMQRI